MIMYRSTGNAPKSLHGLYALFDKGICMNNEIPTDKVINEFRNRGRRNAILGLYCVTALAAIPVAIHTLATIPFPGNGLVSGLAWGLGVIGAVVTLGYSVPKRFLIWNSPNHMFVTQNLLNSFFGEL